MDTDTIINNIKNRTWRKRGKWHNSVLCSEIFGEGEATKSSEKLGFPFKRSRGLWLNDGLCLDLLEEWNGIRDTVEKNYANNPNYLVDYANKCLSMGEEVIKFSEEVSKKDASQLTDGELTKAYVDTMNKCKDYMPFMFSLHIIDEFLTEKFEALLKEFTKKNGVDYFDYLIALALPFRKIFVLQEKQDLVKLALEPNPDLKEHTRKYAWMNAYAMENEPHKIEYFETRLKELLKTDVQKEYELMLNDENKLKEKQKEYMNKIKQNAELYKLAETVQLFGFLRSFRVDVGCIAIANIWNIITEITKRLKIPVLDIKYLDSKEVTNALVGTEFIKLISERKKNLMSIMIDETRLEISDETQIKEILKHIKLEEQQQADFVKGSIAYPGKITGTCKVLHKLEDMKKMNEGDILVISMTDPNYIPAMTKAAAFVTDFGGILCHAAIVSREMKKPCIIGTKDATKVFHDGEKLEVDAEKGIVRKIN